MTAPASVKRRIPKAGVVRYFTELVCDQLEARSGVVVKTAPSNAAILRRFKSPVFKRPPLVHSPHVCLNVEGRIVWLPLEELHLRRKDADAVVANATLMLAHVRRSSPVEGLW